MHGCSSDENRCSPGVRRLGRGPQREAAAAAGASRERTVCRQPARASGAYTGRPASRKRAGEITQFPLPVLSTIIFLLVYAVAEPLCIDSCTCYLLHRSCKGGKLGRRMTMLSKLRICEVEM